MKKENQSTYDRDVASEEWPFNIYLDIKSAGGIYIEDNNGEVIMAIPDELPSDIEGTIMYLLCRLQPRERDIILMYYQQHMTYATIGAKLNGLTRERIRQIINKSLRKLHHGQGKYLIQTGIHNYHMNMHQIDVNNAYEKGFDEGYRKALHDIANGDKSPQKAAETSTQQKLAATKVDDLDFSVRTYNALKRANIQTLEDIINLTGEQMTSIRNLGTKCYLEIYDKLKSLDCDTSNKDEVIYAIKERLSS